MITRHKREIQVALGEGYRVISAVPKWNSRVRVRCIIHSTTFESRADSLKIGSIGCFECKSERMKKVHREVKSRPEYDEFIIRQTSRHSKSLAFHRKEIAAIHGTKIKLVSMEPKHRGTFLCKCGNTWSSRIDSVKAGNSGCVPCARIIMSVKKRKEPDESCMNVPGYRKSWSDTEYLTKKVYRRFHSIINPKGLPWGKEYHVDHIYSRYDAWYNPKNLASPITQLEVCHPANLQILHYADNIRKNKYSWISASELRRRIRAWNKKHGRAFIVRQGIIILS